MGLVNMRTMLIDARKKGYAVGAFNILDYNSMKAVIETASELRSPVIVQTSVKTVEFWGFYALISWIKELAVNRTIPIAIHLDHCKNPDFILECLKAGWTSVMIDASSFPFEKNLELSLSICKMAKPFNATVEAELGEISGVEDDIIGKDDANLADPEKALRFLNEVPVDCFAPAIGTAHGIYKGVPKIAFDRLEIISKSTAIPLALHGGTGLSVDVFHKCIKLGCSKINISTQLKHTLIDGFINYYNSKPEEYNPLTILKSQSDEMKKAVAENIRLFGSDNKA